MTTRPKQSDLTNIFKFFPDNLLDKETFRKLNALSNELDNVFFLDDLGELAADRDAVIRIAKANMLLAPDLHEIALLESAKHLGHHLKKRKGTGRPLTWREAATHGVPIAPLSDAEQRAIGIKKTDTDEELRSLFAQQFPEIDKVWFGPAKPSVTEDVFRNFAHNRTVWDCVVAHIGWWGAMAAFAAASAIILILITSGGALIAAVIWLIAVLGLATTTVITNCIVSPG
jgi:hypothetical protein